MVIFTKYSNERRKEFRICTEIRQEADGTKRICKRADIPAAKAHIESVYRKYELLKTNLSGTGISVNECQMDEKGVSFPYLEGGTLEEKLDTFLEKKQIDLLIAEIRCYFDLFVSGANLAFEETEAFREVFGSFDPALAGAQCCRRVSDIDIVFANAIVRERGIELIDYEWTFDFLIPVKFLQYRCLRYYLLGNEKRSVLRPYRLFEQFGITEAEQQQFASMERKFQSYILGDYTPNWMLYDELSDGVINLNPMIKEESGKRQKRTAEVFFDDGRNFGTWNCRRYKAPESGRLQLEIVLPAGTRRVRLDPCSEKCIVRIWKLEQSGRALTYSSNGLQGAQRDLIFDTEDPQIIFRTTDQTPVQVELLIEPMDGLTRELILNQYGRLRWIEKLKIGKAVEKLKNRRK